MSTRSRAVRYVFALLASTIISCTQYDYIEGGSEYECGTIINGDIRGDRYYLQIQFPDGLFWYQVHKEYYYDYLVYDEICIDSLPF